MAKYSLLVEPLGASWTGFRFINGNGGYLLVIRESNSSAAGFLQIWLSIENVLNVFDAVARVKPDMTVYDHVMELGHAIDKWRWSYQYTYNKIKNLSPASSCVLTWGRKVRGGALISSLINPAHT